MSKSPLVAKAYSYTRMSTADQLRGDSRRRQVDAAQRYADRNGLTIFDRYDDLGVSAFKGKNAELGALNAFIKAVDDGSVERGSYLIVESIDRLSRQAIPQAFALFMDLIGRGIKVVTLSPEQIYSEESVQDSMSLMGALFVMQRAHEESRIKSERVSEAWTEKHKNARDRSVISTRRAPSWLIVKDGTFVVIEGRAELVREIFRLTRDGYGAYTLSRLLNERRIPTWGDRAGSVWHQSTLKKLIRGRLVLGEYQPHKVRLVHGKQTRTPVGDPIVGYYPAIVDVALYREANAAVDARSKTGKGRKGEKYSNVFTGLLKCSCGSGYRYVDKGDPPKGGQYLQCSVALARGACKQPLLRYDVVSSVLLSAVESLDARRVLDGDKFQEHIVEAKLREAQISEAFNAASKRLGNFLDAIGEGTAGTSLKARLEAEELEVSRLSVDLEAARQKLQRALRTDVTARAGELKKLTEAISCKDSADGALMRRALAAELSRLVSKIVIRPVSRNVEELKTGGASHHIDEDQEAADGSVTTSSPESSKEIDWKKKYNVRTSAALEKLARERCFEAHIFYRNGVSEIVDALEGPYFKAKESFRMKTLRMINR